MIKGYTYLCSVRMQMRLLFAEQLDPEFVDVHTIHSCMVALETRLPDYLSHVNNYMSDHCFVTLLRVHHCYSCADRFYHVDHVELYPSFCHDDDHCYHVLWPVVWLQQPMHLQPMLYLMLFLHVTPVLPVPPPELGVADDCCWYFTLMNLSNWNYLMGK